LFPQEELALATKIFAVQQQALKRQAGGTTGNSQESGQPRTFNQSRLDKLVDLHHPDRVLSPETAYIMTHLMKEVVTSGTGYKARALNRPAAGKTGTTNESVDAWFVGFTPELTAAVWVGFDDISRSLGSGETGGKAAAPIWVDYMQQALKQTKTIEDFEVPPKVIFARIDRTTGKLASKATEETVFEAFIEGTAPEESGATSPDNEREKFFLQN